MIKEAVGKVILRRNLSEAEMEEVMQEITTGVASAEQVASFVTALRMKGETPEETAAAARIVKEKALTLNGGDDLVCLDREEITAERETILSTAGSSIGTNIFNISTATALVAAGGGVKVAKYVRRSSFPLCGCADVIEALGVNLDLTPTQLERCTREVGICLLYEPLVKNGLRHIMAVRERIGIRTIFNLLEPLVNPAMAKVQVLGVYEPELTETMARVLKNLGIKRALVVYGDETLDEMSITGKTKITELKGGEISTYFIQPEDVGMKRGRISEIKGGTKHQNAKIILDILEGGKGAARDITALNAAAAFVVAGRAENLDEGVRLANRSIDSGESLNKLKTLIAFTNSEQRFLRNSYQAEI